MEILFDGTNGLPVLTWCPIDRLDYPAIEQARNLSQHPRLFNHAALMADTHTGYGMPIGGVAALIDAISPNMVGSDIGCGMIVTQTDYPANKLNHGLMADIFNKVEAGVPAGYGHYHKRRHYWDGFEKFKKATKNRPPEWMNKNWERAQLSLGTLGGGNHFMEIQEGDDGATYLMIHTGSRGLGSSIHAYYSKLAKAGSIFEKVHPDLAFFDTKSLWGQQYIRDMMFALAYAETNRKIIMDHFEWAFFSSIPLRGGKDVLSRVNIHHNYAAAELHNGKEVWVHRKGATSARSGELGIIPGSMGTASYIVAGKSNPASFRSCSHGAGRLLSRGDAKDKIPAIDVEKAMEGIYVHSDHLPKDEAPQAYKDIEEVIINQRDLIDVVRKLKPRGVYKG